MSTNPSQESETRRLGSRENYFDSDSDRYENAAEQPGHVEKPAINKDAWMAQTILRRAPGATLLCPRCFDELEQRRELSEPSEHVAPSEYEDETEDGEQFIRYLYTDHRRHRYCPNCAEIAWGGILEDKPLHPDDRYGFLQIVGDVLRAYAQKNGLRRSLAIEIMETARHRKRKGWSDESNMERVVHELRHGVADDA